METKHVQIGEMSFRVDVAGPPMGEPVLLLHGFPETGHMWRHALESLGRAGYRAIAPDQRGYSPDARPSPTAGYMTEHLIADALSLMDALGVVGPFDLVGHDWGGQLSWLIAAHHPDSIRTLSIASRPHPAAFVRAMKEDAAQSERSRHHRSFRADDAIQRVREAGLQSIRESLENQAVPPASADIYVKALLEPGGIEGAMSWYRAGSTFDLGRTPTIAAPTMYVWGDHDATVGVYAAELTREYVDGPYEFVRIDGGTHFVVDQFPERMSTLILNHIRRFS